MAASLTEKILTRSRADQPWGESAALAHLNRSGTAEAIQQFVNAPATEQIRSMLQVRVGCDLVYETCAETSFLLDVLPQLEGGQIMVGEQLTLGDGMTAEAIENSHENRLLRVLLPAGRTEFRHDALLFTPPTYDNEGVSTALIVPPEQLPADVLRYTLPSR